jgi:hypothetical protein
VPFDGIVAHNCTGLDGITGVGGESCCIAQPCLFNMAIDREENHDVAAANPTIVKALLEIIAGYAKTEVSIQEAGRLSLLRLPSPHFPDLSSQRNRHMVDSGTHARRLIHARNALSQIYITCDCSHACQGCARRSTEPRATHGVRRQLRRSSRPSGCRGCQTSTSFRETPTKGVLEQYVRMERAGVQYQVPSH